MGSEHFLKYAKLNFMERKRVGINGAVVARNIQRFRESKNLTRPDLARRINALEQPTTYDGWELQPSKINALAITRIENGERRTDADDLMLFAWALGVTPISLLMAEADKDSADVHSPGGVVGVVTMWDWLNGRWPLSTVHGLPEDGGDDVRAALNFYTDALPTWEWAQGTNPMDGYA